MTRDYHDSDISPFSNTYYSEEVGLWEKIRWGVVKPLWQPQDSSNRHADLLVNMASLLDVPLADLPYSFAQARAQGDSAYQPLSRPYNLVGDFVFSGIGTTMTGYAARVADLEGVRRAAVTLSRLRSEGYGVGEAPGAISDSAIKNPYTELPFEWDEDGRAIVFEGLEEHDRGTHRLPY